MTGGKKYIRFDWAMKRLLRQKTNFVVLEGLLTSLLGREIKIAKMLESEGNADDIDSKYNRVDILAEDERGELMLIEVQNANEYAYFQRMVFGVSRLVTDYMHAGDNYEKVRKVYSINIVYFPLGVGEDYVYHGTTEFHGLHKNDTLQLSNFQKKKFDVMHVMDIFPEYYILRANDFNKWSSTSLDQWMYFLSTGEIPVSATAPGLSEARKRLEVDSLAPEAKVAYYKHLDDMVILEDTIKNSQAESRAEGRAEGRQETIIEMARFMKRNGMPTDKICEGTGLSASEVEKL